MHVNGQVVVIHASAWFSFFLSLKRSNPMNVDTYLKMSRSQSESCEESFEEMVSRNALSSISIAIITDVEKRDTNLWAKNDAL